MGQSRTIRLEVEIKLEGSDETRTRLTKPNEKLSSIAATTVEAAVEAYHDTDATPRIESVNVRYAYFVEQAKGSEDYSYPEDAADID